MITKITLCLLILNSMFISLHAMENKEPKSISLNKKDLKIIKEVSADEKRDRESLFIIPATYFVGLNDKKESITYLQATEKNIQKRINTK